MNLLHSEVIKLMSVRSPWWCASLAIAATALITVLFAALSEEQRLLNVATTQIAYNFGMAIVMVMAALTVTTEYRFNTIWTTFQATPNRYAALGVKSLVVCVLGGLVGLVSSLLNWGLARIVAPTADLDLVDAAAWRQVIGVAPVYFFAAMLAIGIGILVHQTAPAITVIMVYTFLVEPAIPFIPSVGAEIEKWLPLLAANHFLVAGASEVPFGPRIVALPYGPWAALTYFVNIQARPPTWSLCSGV